jgi:hypothetical protein
MYVNVSIWAAFIFNHFCILHYFKFNIAHDIVCTGVHVFTTEN